MHYKKNDGSTCFHRVGEVEFWLTPQNKIFLIHEGRTIFPSLQGTRILNFDDPMFHAADKVGADLLRIMRKQHQLRQGWVAERAADDIADQYVD